jgi:hypothetical protein
LNQSLTRFFGNSFRLSQLFFGVCLVLGVWCSDGPREYQRRVLKTTLSNLLMSGSARIAMRECVEGVPRVSEGRYNRYTVAEGV